MPIKVPVSGLTQPQPLNPVRGSADVRGAAETGGGVLELSVPGIHDAGWPREFFIPLQGTSGTGRKAPWRRIASVQFWQSASAATIQKKEVCQLASPVRRLKGCLHKRMMAHALTFLAQLPAYSSATWRWSAAVLDELFEEVVQGCPQHAGRRRPLDM